jgi:hypothetical protein
MNLDRKEFIHPHKLGSGLKLGEQLGTHPGTAAALIVLLASSPESRGGGDIRTASPALGRWAGDRVVIVGDYAEDDDLSLEKTGGIPASELYDKCQAETERVENDDQHSPTEALMRSMDGKWVHYVEIEPSEFTDISEMVCKVIEEDLGGKFTGTGWRRFQFNGGHFEWVSGGDKPEQPVIKPDGVIAIPSED